MPLYTITNKDSDSAGHGRVYIGSCTIPIARRMARHYYLGDHAGDASPALYRDMRATLVRARATAKYASRSTAAILREFYVTETADRGPGWPSAKYDLAQAEQALLDATQKLSLTPCYNVRRPLAKDITEEQRNASKAAYQASKQLCSCGRMVSRGNRSHKTSAVHRTAGAD